MSVSKPSREVHVVQVPSVPSFDARFVYNYHVPAEGSDATAGVSDALLSKPGEYFDARVVDYLGSGRAPRYVVFGWKPVSYRDRVYGQSPYRSDAPLPRDYIRTNLAKVLSVDHFASERYTSIDVTDQSIDRKLYQYISSSATLLNLESQAMTARGLAQATDAITSDQTDFQFLSKYLVQPAEDNAFFFETNGQETRLAAASALKGFSMEVQFSNSVIGSLVKRATDFPEGTFSSVYLPMFEVSQRVQGQAKAQGLRDLSADDYRTIAPEHVSVRDVGSAAASLATRARVVGYIVDRSELQANGNVVALPPLVVEDAAASVAVDLRVKYYSTYQYAVRTVAELTVPSIVEETGELVVGVFLIASKPSTPILVECQEFVPPPPPSDVRFTWHWDEGKLFVSWSFPPTPQRDVKQFQVFRRASVLEPFQLVEQIAFDDSVVPAPYHERPDPRLIETVTDPKLSWTDAEFSKASSFIYALGSVDAHGLVSAYGPQTRVTFDAYRNRLVAERLSPAGAPRPYPNAFLDADVFKDSVVESKKTTMTVAFVPEHLRVVDDSGRDLGFLKTDRDGASYRILAMNTDLASADSVDIVVRDRRPTKTVADPFASLAVPDYGDAVAKGAR